MRTLAAAVALLATQSTFDPVKILPEAYSLQFEKLVCAPGRTMAIAADPGEPSLLIDLTREVGRHGWVAAGQGVALRNDGADSREWLRFDLKTPPRP